MIKLWTQRALHGPGSYGSRSSKRGLILRGDQRQGWPGSLTERTRRRADRCERVGARRKNPESTGEPVTSRSPGRLLFVSAGGGLRGAAVAHVRAAGNVIGKQTLDVIDGITRGNAKF